MQEYIQRSIIFVAGNKWDGLTAFERVERFKMGKDHRGVYSLNLIEHILIRMLAQ